jgi:hypothetical protein
MDYGIIIGRAPWGKPLYARNCILCGKRMGVPAQSLRIGKGKYCGYSCAGKANRAKRRPTTVPLTERFWSKVNKNGPIPPHRPRLGRCWVWTGYCLPFGQGTIRIGGRSGRHHPAPRIAWELEHGPIPDGLWALHKCDNASCVRSSHLFLGTHVDNMADMKAKGRARTKHGSANGRALLTETAVRQIRRLRAKGWLSPELASKFGVSTHTIRAVVQRRLWKHVA